MNYYEILNIARSATPGEIKRAYRELAEIHHPDRMHALRVEVQERAAAQLKLINEAYRVLQDPAMRARYDASLAVTVAESSEAPPIVQPGEATGSLTRRLEAVEREIVTTARQIEQLRVRVPEMQVLDRTWNYYQFASISLVLIFLFAGTWLSLVWASAPTSLLGLGALVGLLLFGYLALLIVALVSGTKLTDRRLWRMTLALPLLLLMLVGAIIIGLPRTVRLLLLLGGYALVVWQGVGRPLAERRDDVAIAMSRMVRLQDTLYDYQIERDALRAELARR
ncbi:MAG: J domain-containing protein [Ardenticatenaceae bacterium]